jgi:hypothetical protein
VFYKTFVTLVNFNGEDSIVNINTDFHPILDQGLVVVSSSAAFIAG